MANVQAGIRKSAVPGAGHPFGVATLDETGHVPASQLPAQAGALTTTSLATATLAAGVLTASAPMVHSQPWNNGAVDFVGKSNEYTITGGLGVGAGAGSVLERWRVGGVSLVEFGPASSVSSPALRFGDSTTGFYRSGADRISAAIAGNVALQLGGSANSVSFGKLALQTPSTGTENTAVGYNALSFLNGGGSNTAVGAGSGTIVGAGWDNCFFGRYAGNLSTGTSGVAVGSSALANATGSYNVAVGDHASYHNTSGANNVSVGASALASNLTGSNNVAVGYFSLSSNLATGNVGLGPNTLPANTTGYENTASGSVALFVNIDGYQNCAYGAESLFTNASGYGNAAYGVSSLHGNTTGHSNVGLGWTAGGLASNPNANTTGSNNTFLGADTVPSSATQQNYMTLVGSGATGARDNAVILGRSADTVVCPGSSIEISTSSTPASASATGVVGAIKWDSSFVYICVATNTWKRAAIATW